MNYYERHLGDYAKDTAHLSMLEHGAFNLLLDRYYATEAGIPADQAHRIARARSRDDKKAVDDVLCEFFELIDGKWINHRAEQEILKAHTRIEAAKKNGGKGGRPPKRQTETQDKPAGFSVGSESESEAKAHHVPHAIHQTPEDQKQSAAPKAHRFDPIRHLADLGVSESVGRDWLTLRKAKKAAATETAIGGIAREAQTAGLSLHDALSVCCSRGWAGFKAEWVANVKPIQSSFQSSRDQKAAGVAASLGMTGEPVDDGLILEGEFHVQPARLLG
jgi:uncharacterized protein YdaU (DUF1376 family)